MGDSLPNGRRRRDSANSTNDDDQITDLNAVDSRPSPRRARFDTTNTANNDVPNSDTPTEHPNPNDDPDTKLEHGEDDVARPVPCSTCEVGVGQYRCPRCDARSCSVACVQAHKTASGCSGVRSKVTYVRPRDYSPAHFASDFALLDDVARAVDRAERVAAALGAATVSTDSASGTTVANTSTKAAQHRTQRAAGPGSYRRTLLARESARRGVQLRLMPMALARATANQSLFRVQAKRLAWSLELCYVVGSSFPKDATLDVACDTSHNAKNDTSFAVDTTPNTAPPCRTSTVDTARFQLEDVVDETQAVNDVIVDHLSLDSIASSIRTTLNLPTSAILTPVSVMLWDLDGGSLHTLDASQTLADALKGRSIVEFPRLLVEIAPHSDQPS